MNNLKSANILVFASLLLAATLHQTAEANSLSETNHHTLAITFSFGALDIDSTAENFAEDDAKHYRFAYTYQYDNGLYLGAGYLNGESGEVSPLDDLFRGDELTYDSVFMNAGYRHALSSRQSLNVEVAAHSYDTELSVNNVAFADGGTGFGFSIGWRYDLDSGIGFTVGLEHLQLGSDLDIQSFGSGISYSF